MVTGLSIPTVPGAQPAAATMSCGRLLRSSAARDPAGCVFAHRPRPPSDPEATDQEADRLDIPHSRDARARRRACALLASATRLQRALPAHDAPGRPPGPLLERRRAATRRSTSGSRSASTRQDRLHWRDISPRPRSPVDPERPAAYRARQVAALRRAIRGAQARGMEVFLMIGGPAPDWAARPSDDLPPACSARTRPCSAVRAGRGHALLRRLHGAGRRLPRPAAAASVTLWSVWNEPNLASWLSRAQKPTRRRSTATCCTRASTAWARPATAATRSSSASCCRSRAASRPRGSEAARSSSCASSPASTAASGLQGQRGEEARLHRLQGAARHRPRLPPVHAAPAARASSRRTGRRDRSASCRA